MPVHLNPHTVHGVQGYSLLQLAASAEKGKEDGPTADHKADTRLISAVSDLFAAASALGQDANVEFDSDSDQVDVDLMGQDGPRLEAEPAHKAGVATMRRIIACLADDLTGSHPIPSLQASPAMLQSLCLITQGKCPCKYTLSSIGAACAHAYEIPSSAFLKSICPHPDCFWQALVRQSQAGCHL